MQRAGAGVDDRGYSDIAEAKDVPPGLALKAREGAANCPERAIRIEA